MSSFLGFVNKELAIFAVIKLTGTVGIENVYTMTDDANNILIWQTEKVIDKSDGKHFFLIEGKVKEHQKIKNLKQTVLMKCRCTLIDKADNIHGDFYGKPCDIVELDNVTARFSKVFDRELVADDECTFKVPNSDYLLIISHKDYTFLLPFNSTRRFTFKDRGKFNIKGEVIGHLVKDGNKATFLQPIAIDDKNGPFYGSGPKGVAHSLKGTW